MSRGPTNRALLKPTSYLPWTLLLAGLSLVMWAVWLGWDQRPDIQPDGTTTGPYQAWQVAGLVLTLLAATCWTALRGHGPAAVLGTTAGLTVASYWDWSDDASGLFVIGVGLVMLLTLAATAAVSAVCGAVTRGSRQHRTT
ncbi:hypothetical protein [Streptomyces mexicanus]|uniref:Uncharacterized protein n=1 Tax=Streptomyces mexicanus TaxID=178566 RepID=A0A7X1HZS3_9ACTN|nr:hypothetical protein [Streptomyces mexicanus]MBC2865670.1 hypothetical protein [Streptomyces mexicanus]